MKDIILQGTQDRCFLFLPNPVYPHKYGWQKWYWMETVKIKELNVRKLFLLNKNLSFSVV